MISFNGLSFPTEIPISFTRPSAKVSTECANGYFNPLEISLAATNSGLITKSIPNTSFTKPYLEEYSCKGSVLKEGRRFDIKDSDEIIKNWIESL